MNMIFYHIQNHRHGSDFLCLFLMNYYLRIVSEIVVNLVPRAFVLARRPWGRGWLQSPTQSLNNNSWGKDKGNHYRVGGFVCDKKSCSFTKSFSFDFLDLFLKLHRQWIHVTGCFSSHLKHSQSVLYQI